MTEAGANPRKPDGMFPKSFYLTYPSGKETGESGWRGEAKNWKVIGSIGFMTRGLTKLSPKPVGRKCRPVSDQNAAVAASTLTC